MRLALKKTVKHVVKTVKFPKWSSLPGRSPQIKELWSWLLFRNLTVFSTLIPNQHPWAQDSTIILKAVRIRVARPFLVRKYPEKQNPHALYLQDFWQFPKIFAIMFGDDREDIREAWADPGRAEDPRGKLSNLTFETFIPRCGAWSNAFCIDPCVQLVCFKICNSFFKATISGASKIKSPSSFRWFGRVSSWLS